jgi:hypothetical protein
LQTPLFAQELDSDRVESITNGEIGESEEMVEPSHTAEDEPIVFYIIRKIDFSITGRTRPFALYIHGEFQEGVRITGQADLEKYIKDKTQLLLNQRVLESVHIAYTLGSPGEDGLVPVDLLVSTVDTWNIIVLPKPQFDSNTGFELTLKARDYNFFGAMNPLRVDLGYALEEDELGEFSKGSFKFEIDSDTPFKAFGYTWNLNFDHIFAYTYEEPFSYKNITGISMELPWKWTTFTFGFEENFILNEENDDKYKEKYGTYFQDTWYLSSELYTAWKIPLSLDVGTFGKLTYTPKLSGKLNYRPGGELDYLRKGPVITFNQILGFGRIDWIGNYRSGVEASLGNTNAFNVYKKGWDNNITVSATGHKLVTGFFGVSGRLQYRHWFYDNSEDIYDSAGDSLRGVLDKSLHADYMLALNLDFPFQALHFVPSEWLHNQKLHFFDFDLHVSPIIDMALIRDPVADIDFSFKAMLFSGGVEFLLFPHFTRSFYIRASIGFNLKAWAKTGSLPGGDNREIFIGIGHHY